MGSRTHRRREDVDGDGDNKEVYDDGSVQATIDARDHASGFREVR